MSSVDTWIEMPPIVIVSQTSLVSWCWVPNQMNWDCVTVGVQFQAVGTHPVADLRNTSDKLPHFAVDSRGISMAIQLAVVCVGVHSKTTSPGNSYDIRAVNQEKHWSKYTALSRFADE